ncbi:MAG TPA: alpha/beta hydrolase [Propionibacteriaceae bacterium]|nr:alpha/beta hydrolase [Propionibacteriaceae bacterium]
MVEVTEGKLSSGLPYLRLGQGPPLVMASGLSSEHANPTGQWRRMSLSAAAPFAKHFTVYLANRKAGLASESTMAGIAADYARAIENDIGAPVMVLGTSTGGSVALQLAIDHPHLVKRLVLVAAACRLSPRGRQIQAEVARLTKDGDVRRAWALMMGTLAPGLLRYPARGLGWLAGRRFTAENPADMLITIAAEDAFDAEPDLHRVQAPTLVLGGTADAFYSEDLFRRTGTGIPNGRAVIFPGKGHVYVTSSKIPASIGLGFLLS